MGELYCIPRLQDIKKYLEFAEKYNACFEYNDFFIPKILDDSFAIDKVVKQYMEVRHVCLQDTIHGAFLDICVNSEDPEIFAASDYRVHQCMDIAKRMDAKAVVFHTNYIVNFRLRTYIDSWINRNEEYWRQIINEYKDQYIYIENMFDDAPFMLAELAKRMADEPHFGVCFDIAHAFISGSPVEDWYNVVSPYVKHIHANDNDGVEDLHNPVGEGRLEWDVFDSWCRGFKDKPSLLVEVRSFEDLEKSVKYMQEHNIYPFG